MVHYRFHEIQPESSCLVVSTKIFSLLYFELQGNLQRKNKGETAACSVAPALKGPCTRLGFGDAALDITHLQKNAALEQGCQPSMECALVA
jgi:hypothetical protein